MAKTHFDNVVDDFSWREAIFDATPGAREALGSEKVKCYIGFDPTSSTLHVGNLLGIMMLVRMQQYGHTPIAVVGGGTGLIGDPGGRTEERALRTAAETEEDAQKIRRQLESFLDFDERRENPARLINNIDWLGRTSLLEFLRDVGKHFSVNTMLGRESVRGRIDRDSGISFAEFSYQLLQAYDFQMLYEREDCTFQMGGSDQWGNILGGVDLIRRVHGARPDGGLLAHGLVYPLVTVSAGEKFGKSIGGAPALDPEVTSPYRLYQFFLNLPDSDVVRYIRLFTMLGPDEVGGLERQVEAEPQMRAAQRALASEVTRTVHGESGLARAQQVTEALFGGELSDLSAAELEDVFMDAPGGEIPRAQLEGPGVSIQELAVSQGVGTSGGDVRRTVEQGGLYLNGGRVEDVSRAVTTEDLIDGRLLIIRRGRKNYHLVRVSG